MTVIEIDFFNVVLLTLILVSMFTIYKLKNDKQKLNRFKESVLNGLKAAGHNIERSKCCSEVDGFDGVCYISNVRHLVQSKRYTGKINLRHLKEFHQVCLLNNSKGIFVHSGGAAGTSIYYARTSDLVDVVSGERLVRLLNGQHESL